MKYPGEMKVNLTFSIYAAFFQTVTLLILNLNKTHFQMFLKSIKGYKCQERQQVKPSNIKAEDILPQNNTFQPAFIEFSLAIQGCTDGTSLQAHYAHR